MKPLIPRICPAPASPASSPHSDIVRIMRNRGTHARVAGGVGVGADGPDLEPERASP